MIELVNVTKSYRLGDIEIRALDNVTLSIAAGEFIAVIGASGSGKSTLMNIIGCLDTPTSGEYILNGMPIAGLSRDELALLRNRTIGFVFQNFNLLPRMPAIQQVELPLVYSGVPARQRRQLAIQALDVVGLGDRLYHAPMQLSGGQQQRVAIARAMVNRPAIILADEPTGNLDSRTSLEIIGIFQDLNRKSGITVVYVTHEHEIAMHADRMLHMVDGRIDWDRRVDKPLRASEELQGAPAPASEEYAADPQALSSIGGSKLAS